MQDATSSPWLSNGAEGGEEDTWSDHYLSPHDDDVVSSSHSLSSSSLPEPMDALDGLSFILMQDLSAEAIPIYVTQSIKDLLGWEPQALHHKSFFELVHPDEVAAARALHYKLVQDNGAATLTYLRLKHASGDWALCAHSRSVIHDMVIGGISLATNGPKAALKAATASEVFVLTPEASRFAFRRWTPLTVPTPNPIFTASSVDQTIPIHDLPTPSRRVGLLLNRFIADVLVMHCTNNQIIFSDLVFNRSIYELVEDPDIGQLKSTIEMVKTWGASDEPGDGGFCPCTFSFVRDVIVGSPNASNRMDATVSAHSDAVILVVKPQGD